MRKLVLDDPARAAAEALASAVRAGGHIALSGGNTPRLAYERAARVATGWKGCTFWFGDERCVPPDDERSNYAMVRAALFDQLRGDMPSVRRIEGERGPDDAAASYERELIEVLGVSPRLDLVLLGLGPDAHCASLFPNQPSLNERHRFVVGVDEAGLPPSVPRVTLTLPVINAAREVVFLVAGAEKAAAVARAFGGVPDPAAPASLVAPASGRLTVLLDPKAAAELASMEEASWRS